jgi:hypothetical protein
MSSNFVYFALKGLRRDFQRPIVITWMLNDGHAICSSRWEVTIGEPCLAPPACLLHRSLLSGGFNPNARLGFFCIFFVRRLFRMRCGTTISPTDVLPAFLFALKSAMIEGFSEYCPTEKGKEG